MKQFLTVVFGGLAAIGLGIAISYAGSLAWPEVSPKLKSIGGPLLSAVAESIAGKPDDGTSISGIVRTIRFTANEEEDISFAASRALPVNLKKGITAEAYIVKDLSANGTAISREPDRLLPIASVTKLVTAAVARKLIALDTKITLDRSIMAAYGNTADFRVGETFTAGDLIYPLLMVSSNDTAEAYAQSYGRAKFIAAMNDFTQSIGAYRTYFADPSGLSPKNVSTANDLALIIGWIRQNDPGIIDITQLKTKTVRAHTWVNPTHFLSMSNYVGGKNGYTPEADRTAVSLFSKGPKKDLYAIVVLGSDERDSDEMQLLGMIGKK